MSIIPAIISLNTVVMVTNTTMLNAETARRSSQQILNSSKKGPKK